MFCRNMNIPNLTVLIDIYSKNYKKHIAKWRKWKTKIQDFYVAFN